jgi:predicted DNA-binding protein (UPF0251 family)
MARPVKRRRICEMPGIQSFAPCGRENLKQIFMTVDEYEAIRLIDYMGLSQVDCAAQMNVARTTVQSIYDSARKKLANMLVKGYRLEICGGAYDLCPHSAVCCGKNCGAGNAGRCGMRRCENGSLKCIKCREDKQKATEE